MTIKTFQIEYDAINSKNIFTNGDTINGRIIVEASKDTAVQSLVFLAVGEARVSWSEHYGEDNHHVYWADEKYYSVAHDILRESRQDRPEIIKKGKHVFPFTFTIPERKMPSTFKTSIGTIVHKVKAKLRQPMKLTKEVKAHFTFVSKADQSIPGLMEPQHQSKDKSLAFGSGDVSLAVYTKKMGYKPGEALKISVKLNNLSSRSMKPKLELYEKLSYFADGRRNVNTHIILKDKMDIVNKQSGKTAVTKVINIPEVPSSILNCSIIKREYRLKVYLHIKFAKNLHVKLPIVILPDFSEREEPSMSPGFGFQASGNTMQPTQSTRAQTVDLPPSYGAHAMYPLISSDKYTSGL